MFPGHAESTSSATLAAAINATRIIHVRNFPESCSHTQIRDCFKVYGEIGECLILHDSYAFVHYAQAHEARAALHATNNAPFLHGHLLVQYSRSKFKQQTQTHAHALPGGGGGGGWAEQEQVAALGEMVEDLAVGGRATHFGKCWGLLPFVWSVLLAVCD